MHEYELWKLRYEGAVARFLSGEDSIDVFRAHLFSLGFVGHRLDDEVSYQSDRRSNAA